MTFPSSWLLRNVSAPAVVPAVTLLTILTLVGVDDVQLRIVIVFILYFVCVPFRYQCLLSVYLL